MLFKFAFVLLLTAVFTSGESLYEDEKRLYDFGLGKRAYAYASQYKRLPVYNFGLGKRAATDAKNLYAFGLGKRDAVDENKAVDEVIDELDVEKRARGGYDFGLGKRISASSYNYNFGLGKKATPQYSFGLGKRLGFYNFGLGKRTGKYGFGLGKKDRTYSFGLGKRYDYRPTDEDEEDFDFGQDMMEEKRGGKFSFGLGKRENSLGELLASINDDSDPLLSDKPIRSPHYDFGLGKRSVELPVNSVPRLENKENQQTISKTLQ